MFYFSSRRIIIRARCSLQESGSVRRSNSQFLQLVVYRNFSYCHYLGDLIVAKGQQRKTKEAKKPKKQPAK